MGDSLIAKPFKIFRLINPGDTSSTDFILFNDATSPDFKNADKEGAYISELKRDDPESIGNNQAAEVPDGNVQPGGIIEGIYTITGFITNMRGNSDNGVNSFTVKLREWKTGPQAINGVWGAGTFGIVDDSDIDNSVSPVGTGENALGLIFQGYTKTNDYPRNRVEIILTFRRSRGIPVQ